MSKKWLLATGLLMIIGLFASAGLARAGGWATVTLSELPEEVVAERPFTKTTSGSVCGTPSDSM